LGIEARGHAAPNLRLSFANEVIEPIAFCGCISLHLLRAVPGTRVRLGVAVQHLNAARIETCYPAGASQAR